MKELYFTVDNISEKAQSWLNGIKIKTKVFDVEQSALLVLDMQKFFLDESSHACIPSAKAIIPNIQSLITFFNEHNRPIIFTQHINDEINAGLMKDWWQDVLATSSSMSEIVEDFCNRYTIEKTQYDAFYNTDLESILKNKDVKNVVITGVMAHLCCETTARSAFVRGFQPFFIADATATYNADFHNATLLNLGHGFADIRLTKELING